MNRREWLCAIAALSGAPIAATAQQGVARRRIGVLRAAPDEPGFRENFRHFLAALGEGSFVQGSNLAIEYRVQPGSPSEVFMRANELVLGAVDVILGIAAPGVTAAAKATTAIPIVAIDLESDPIASGFVSSLARPNRNITGVFLDFPELSGKWIQLLKEALPRLARVAVLWDPQVGPYLLRGAESAGTGMGVQVLRLEARGPADLAAAFASASNHKVEAVLALSSPVFLSARRQIADLASKYRLPAIMPFPPFADDGGLIAYGPHLTTMFRQAGAAVTKILQGARPQDIPIERPARFELAINARTARALGVVIPQALLIRADRVIE